MVTLISLANKCLKKLRLSKYRTSCVLQTRRNERYTIDLNHEVVARQIELTDRHHFC